MNYCDEYTAYTDRLGVQRDLIVSQTNDSQIITMAKDRERCILIMGALITGNRITRLKFSRAIIRGFSELVFHPVGMSTLRKFIVYGQAEHLRMLVDSFDTILLRNVSICRQGNLFLQEIFTIETYFKNRVFSVLRGEYRTLSMNFYGSFIVVKAIEEGFLYEVVNDINISYASVVEVARHRRGKVIMMKVLTAMKEKRELRYIVPDLILNLEMCKRFLDDELQEMVSNIYQGLHVGS